MNHFLTFSAVGIVIHQIQFGTELSSALTKQRSIFIAVDEVYIYTGSGQVNTKYMIL